MHVRFPFWFRGTRPVLNVRVVDAEPRYWLHVGVHRFTMEKIGQAVVSVEIWTRRRLTWVDLWYGPCRVEAE